MIEATPDELLRWYRAVTIAQVRDEAPDLTSRQTAVFLNVYLVDASQTVRGLAHELNVSKPAITRALDRLELFQLARRQTDPKDRRSIIVLRTAEGTRYLNRLRSKLASATRERVRA
jgi:DNA-binding MarR family transcriptional regulator